MHLTMTIKVTKATRTILDLVGTKTRVVAEAVDTVVETPITTINTKTNTIPNSMVDMVDSHTVWVTTDTPKEA